METGDGVKPKIKVIFWIILGSYGNDVTVNTYVETSNGRWFPVEPEKTEILENGTIITKQFIEG